MANVKVKCHKCGHLIEVASKKRPLKVKCPECKAVGILRAPPPKSEPKIKKKEEKEARLVPKPKPKKELKEKAKPLAISPKPTPALIFKPRNFLKARIAKPVVIIIIIAIILTSLQQVSLISTGETVIVMSDFGILEEFAKAKQDSEAQCDEVTGKAEGLLNDVNWSVEELPERNISYGIDKISKPKPEWARIFSDIEEANITPETTNKSWTHTTTADFQNNCSSSENVNIDDMIKLSGLGQGMFISDSLDSGTDNAVLKEVDWHGSTPLASQIVIIVEVSYTGDVGTWIPVWSSADVLPDFVKQLFPDIKEIATEVISGRYFRYLVGFYGLLGKPQLEDITIKVATATLDRRYYVFTYYQSDAPLVDRDGVAGGEIPQLGITLPENNSIDVDGDGDEDDLVVSLVLTGIVNEPITDWPIPPTHLIGGLKISIYKIDDVAPLKIYFVKPVNYENKTYIWIIGFYFSSLPSTFSFTTISENITLEAVAFGMGGETPVEVKPPYQITWSMTSQIPEFSLAIGYAKFGPVNATHYFEAKFSPGISNGYLYYEEAAEKISLNWIGSNKTDISASYKEENIYAEFGLENLPSNLNLSIVNLSAKMGRPFSILEYNASASLSKFSYIYYDFSAEQIAKAELVNLPSKLVLRGTFTIPPKQEPSPDPSDTFIGRALNYVIARISAAMNRVRKALKSIPETLYTPDNIFLLQPTGTITKLEFAFLNGQIQNDIIQADFLNLSGNYLGMLNDSVQARLKNVTKLELALGRNITLVLKRSGAREPLEAIYVSGDTKILANIPELPSELSIQGTTKELDFTFTEPVELELLAETQNYNLQAWLKNAQAGKLIKGANFSLYSNSDLELFAAIGKNKLYKMNGSYIFANTSEQAVTLKLENLRALEVGAQLALKLSQEHPLKILLASNLTSGKILIKDLPSNFNFSLAQPLLALPELEEVSFGAAPELFSSVASALAQAIQSLDKLAEEGFVSEKLELSYESLSKAPILIANLSAGKNTLTWLHGIALNKSKSALSLKAYLELPKKAAFVLDQEELELRYRFKEWAPSFNWLTASLELENKELFAYLANITLDRGEGIIKLVEEKPVEEVEVTPVKRLEELNLTLELFISALPQNLNLTFTRKPNLSMVWNASSRVPSIYLSVVKKAGSALYKSYFIAKEVPQKFEFTLVPSSKSSTQTLALQETLPELKINASAKSDFWLKLAGELLGRTGDYELYAEGLKCYSVEQENNALLMTGEVDKLSFQVANATVGALKVEKVKFLVKELNSVRFAAHSLFGKLPVLELTCNVKELQLNLKVPVNTPIGKVEDIALANFAFLSLNTRKNSIRITDAATHYILVAPVLSFY